MSGMVGGGWGWEGLILRAALQVFGGVRGKGVGGSWLEAPKQRVALQQRAALRSGGCWRARMLLSMTTPLLLWLPV